MGRFSILTSVTVFGIERRMLNKFKMAVQITLWCIKTGKRHCVQSQSASELSSFFNMNFAAMDTFQNVDLLFDPSKFKANRGAQIALRNIKCFAEFPDRMQRKIAEVGMYEKFDARRVLLRQGHQAHCFYFILSGAVAVLVLEEGRSFAKVAVQLEKGQSFGELAIITRSKRQSTVVVKEKSEFLTISLDDYHKIFMSGGIKSVTDPDHEEFVKSLPFLHGWPVQKLRDEATKCVFLYFKRGDVIVKDSKYSDWIIVVKSGSLCVMKKLRKVEAYEWRKPKGFTFVSDKEKRERQDKLTNQRRQVLPELQVPLRGTRGARPEEDTQIREEGRLRPFVHPDQLGPDVAVVDVDGGSNDAKVWDLGSAGLSGQGLDSVTYVHIPHDDVNQKHGQKRKPSGGNVRPKTVGSVQQSESLLPGRKSPRADSRVHSPLMYGPIPEVGGEESLFEVRTIQQELDEFGAKKDPDDITAADLNPEFVHVQTLTKGMCFGLSDLILGPQTSFCVVSNGADVILVNKQMYHEHASEGLLRKMRQDLCPYPSEEELQTKLQTNVDWASYRQSALADTIKGMRLRRSVRV